MPIEPIVLAAIIAAVAGLVAALLGVIPHVGRLRRLERVMAVVKDVEEGESRETLIDYRDRLVRGFKPRQLGTGALVAVSMTLVLLAVGVAAWAQQFAPKSVPAMLLGSATGALIAVAGSVLVFMYYRLVRDGIALLRDVRARRAERDRARAADLSRRAEEVLPESSPHATSPRPERSARPRRRRSNPTGRETRSADGPSNNNRP